MPVPVREIETTYHDPLDLIWIHAAAEIGMEIKRDPEVFAAWNGAGVLRIGTPATLDPDDSLAQMVLHELCHALVEGPDSFTQPDWGLDMFRSEHRVHEFACLRLQAALAGKYGLRQVLASTTDFRAYYDALPQDPLVQTPDPLAVTPDEREPETTLAIDLAVCGMQRATEGPWSVALNEALRRTAQLASIIVGICPAESIWSRYQPV